MHDYCFNLIKIRDIQNYTCNLIKSIGKLVLNYFPTEDLSIW